MVFLLLNILLAVLLVFLTVYTDKVVRNDVKDSSSLLVPLLLVSIESILLCFVLFFKNTWEDAFIKGLLRCIFALDGIFFVAFSFGLIGLAANTRKFFIFVLQLFLMACACHIVFSKDFFTEVNITDGYNIYVGSSLLFSGDAAKFFPFTWVDFYDFMFKGFIPVFAYLFLIMIQEKSGTTLQRYQGFLIGISLVVMWILSYFVKNFMTVVNNDFTCLFIFPYFFMLGVVVTALRQTSVPSGKTMLGSVLQTFVSYIFPACAVAALVTFMQPRVPNTTLIYIAFGAASIVAIIFSLKLSLVLSTSTKIYSADYAEALEKDLGSINYSGEMDEITGRMNEIFRKNVESSSMNVYVLNNKGMLETAYSSNNFHKEIPVSNPIFDELLNIEKSVVVYSEVGHVHDISAIDDQLEKFFEETKSDALFVLNEGRNILGLITLGKRISGDHYKEYDLNVFNKLYSYFFVFGYYMRNISNKEIISVVNREIRMSSQIITSIQENIDHIKNPKVDTGYMMIPARNIGGEFIDMVRLTDTRHLLIVGDLSGKGIAASMNMVILKSIIRTYLAETHDFKDLVVKINSFIRTSFRKGTIFSGLFALMDFETDTMYYINCGVPTLMLYTQVYNNVIEIQGSGHILGFVKDISPYLSVKSTKLNPGDIIMACTDGLVQSHSLRGEQFGKERIQQCILDNSTYPAQRMAQFTFDSLKKFMSKEMEDDVSILVLKYGSPIKENVEEIAVKEKTEEMDIPQIDEGAIAAAMAEAEGVSEAVVDAAETVEAPVVEETAVVEESPVEAAPAENFDMDLPDFSEDELAAVIAKAQAEAESDAADMFVNPISSDL